MNRILSVGKWLLLLAGIAGVTLLLMVFAGYFHAKVDETPRIRQRLAPTDAKFAEVKQITQPRYESAIGAIKPVHEANVASKILARVLEVNVIAGKKVNAGDVLVKLSDDEQRSRVQQAEAFLDSMLAELQLAKIEATRAQQLIATKSISQAEFDTATTRVQTTQAGADRASRAVEEAKVYLDFATVVAPFSGIIVDKAVQPGDTVSPGQTLLSLYDPSQMQLVANVRESLAMKLKVGQQLPARMESLGYECLATVSEVVPKADISSRSFEVKVTGPCPPGVYSGMFGRLMLPLEDEQLLLIPASAIQRVGQLTFVQVRIEDRLSRRSVQVGRDFRGQVEILTGLKAGEQVLIPTSAAEGVNHE
ncbi:MAG: efflux RND transporter periplasmic adaptor subunit [Pirellulaceae bacterium]|nr:efflux RND transporter periplasmic adaptor subunit [Pirellulaceae bacterium]